MKTFSKFLCSVLILCTVLSGCTWVSRETVRVDTVPVNLENEPGHCRAEFFALDTLIRMDGWGQDSESYLIAAAEEVIRLEKLFSVHSDTGDIAALNRAQGDPVCVQPHTAEIIRQSLDRYAETDGAFDIALYRLKCAWGWQDTPRVPSQDEIGQALLQCGADHIRADGSEIILENDVQLDLGGIAKGYIADRLTEMAQDYAVTAALLDLGGNIQTIGNKPDGSKWAVGIRDPENENEYLGILRFPGTRSVVTSGIYERSFEENGVRYGHILDGKTGYPADSGLTSVTVVSDNAALCDALSTALFVMGSDKGQQLCRSRGDFGMILAQQDGQIYVSEDLSPFWSQS